MLAWRLNQHHDAAVLLPRVPWPVGFGRLRSLDRRVKSMFQPALTTLPELAIAAADARSKTDSLVVVVLVEPNFASQGAVDIR